MGLNRLFCFVFLLIILSGCWDVVNIEERGFVMGSAIDLADNNDTKQTKLMMTNQVAVPVEMVTAFSGGGSSENSFLNFTSTGKSIFEMEEKVATLSSKVPYYEHLFVLVVSEDVMRVEKLFFKILDSYIRDVNFRRGIKIVVSAGQAKNILEFTSPNYRLPAIYIDELLEKSSEQVGFFKPVVAGDVEEFHLKNNSYILPYISTDKQLEYDAAAVIHGTKNQMVGILKAEELQGIGMIMGENTLKVIDFLYKGEPFALDVVRYKSKMTTDPSDINDINVTLDIEIEGVIKELVHQADLTNPQVINSIQNAISEHVENTIEKVIHKGQHEFGTDIFDVWLQMETKHYKQWEQVKDDWETGEQIFKNVTFNVNVETEIYSTGTTKRTD